MTSGRNHVVIDIQQMQILDDTLWGQVVVGFNILLEEVGTHIVRTEVLNHHGYRFCLSDGIGNLNLALIAVSSGDQIDCNELKYTSATDLLRYDGECWREDKQLALGASFPSSSMVS